MTEAMPQPSAVKMDISEVVSAPKPKRKKKPMTEEHKAKCKESLKRARIASALKRQQKAEYKKIKQKEEDDEMVATIEKARQKQIAANSDEKDKIISRLQKQLDNITLNDVIPKPKKKPKKLEVIEEELPPPREPSPPPREPSPPPLPKPTPRQPSPTPQPKPTPIVAKPPPLPKPMPYVCKRKVKTFSYF